MCFAVLIIYNYLSMEKGMTIYLKKCLCPYHKNFFVTRLVETIPMALENKINK